MGIIKIRDLIHDYFGHDEETDKEIVSRAVNHVNLDVEAGQFIADSGAQWFGKIHIGKAY